MLLMREYIEDLVEQLRKNGTLDGVADALEAHAHITEVDVHNVELPRVKHDKIGPGAVKLEFNDSMSELRVMFCPDEFRVGTNADVVQDQVLARVAIRDN